IEAQLERVGLSQRMTHLPSQLSGGQQQRVAIARALAGEPRFLLADEPTGNLDSATAAGIMELLFELNGAGTTIIMVTHDPEIAASTGRVVSLRDGQVQVDQVTPSQPEAAIPA
ncbi:MAG: ATP-binding cassette domain-containing protein, partial [Pseudomonadota bacterium]